MSRLQKMNFQKEKNFYKQYALVCAYFEEMAIFKMKIYCLISKCLA